MHEVSLAIHMIECLDEVAKKNHISRIKKVTVQIGEFSNVMPEALQFAFEMMAQSKQSKIKNELLGECKIKIERIPARARCNQCQTISLVTHEKKQCNHCKGYDLEWISGYELQISEVEGA